MDNSLEPESNQTIVWRFNHNRTYVVDPGKDQMISSAKHGVEECSLIARDIFSTRSKTNYHVSASASTQKTITSLWGSPKRTTTLVPSPIFGLTAFLAAIESEGAYALDGSGRLIEDLRKGRTGRELRRS